MYLIYLNLFQDTDWEVVKFGFQNLYELEYLRTYLEEAGGFKLLWVSNHTFVPEMKHSSDIYVIRPTKSNIRPGPGRRFLLLHVNPRTNALL